jgi:hypothetical protein
MLRLRISRRLGLLGPLVALYRYAEKADAALAAHGAVERRPELG